MSWLTPFALLWGLPILGAIVALYLLKLKRKEVRVSSVMLWERAVQDLQANAPFQRLRPSLLLLLQVLTAIFILAALAQPFLRAAADPGSHIALILDGSASMKATDVTGSRFGEAKRQALKLLNNLAPGDRATVLYCGARTQQVAPLGADRETLARLVNGLEAQDSGSDLREGILLASSLLAGKNSPRIVVFSDGATDPLGEVSLGRAKLDFVKCGTRGENVAVTALDLRPEAGGGRPGTGGLSAFVSMRNYGDMPKTFNLEMYRDGVLLDAREERLEPGGEKGEVFPNLTGLKEAITARLDVKDDLATDNEAVLPVRPPARVRVLLVTSGNLFLERALSAFPSVEVTKASAAPPNDGGAYDIQIYDRIPPKVPAASGGMMLIGCDAPFGPAASGNALRYPQVVDWRRDTPVTRYVDFSSIAMEAGTSLKVRSWATPLAEAAGGPVMAFGERDGRRSLQLGFDLLRSDFPLRVGFPIFMANCLSWLAPEAGQGPGMVVRAGGEAVLTPPPSESRQARVSGPETITRLPQKSAQRNVSIEGGRVALGAVTAVGLYTVQPERGAPMRFGVNLFNPRESDLAPVDLKLKSEGRAVARSSGLSGRRELWRYGLLFALLILLLEWAEYHTRSAFSFPFRWGRRRDPSVPKAPTARR